MRQVYATIGLVLLGISPVDAQSIGPSAEMVDRVRELSDWIVDNSDYVAVPEKDPIYIYLSGAELRYMATGNVAKAHEPDTGFNYLALYSTSTMFLREDFELGRDDQILLHELVHHFQWANGHDQSCLGKLEREAYELQTRYAESIGEEPDIPNPLALVFITTC